VGSGTMTRSIVLATVLLTTETFDGTALFQLAKLSENRLVRSLPLNPPGSVSVA
jgi:hypothetical protein